MESNTVKAEPYVHDVKTCCLAQCEECAKSSIPDAPDWVSSTVDELRAALAPMPAPIRQKATLTFTDNPDGTLGVSMEFEPEVTDDTRSGAVHYAIKCMDHLSSLLGGG